MASAVSQTKLSATAEFQPPRSVQLLRAAVLAAAGIAITFTATEHENLAFDLMLLAGSLALIAVATFLEYFAMRGTLESWWIAARSMIALAAAGTMLAVTSSAAMALVVAVWAALTALITLLRLVRGTQSRRVSLPSLLLSLTLTIAVLVVRDDSVAVIGLFGAYAIVRGVFLAIGAFDPRAAQGASDSTPAAEPDTPVTSGNQDD